MQKIFAYKEALAPLISLRQLESLRIVISPFFKKHPCRNRVAYSSFSASNILWYTIVIYVGHHIPMLSVVTTNIFLHYMPSHQMLIHIAGFILVPVISAGTGIKHVHTINKHNTSSF